MKKKAKVYSFLNQKGGVGKTITTISLAGAAAMNKKKTLVIDMDQQGNSSIGLGINNPDGTIYEALTKGEIEVYEYDKYIHLLPADDRLGQLEIELSKEPLGRENRLKKLIDAEFRSDYDFIFIDSPPSVNIYSVNSLIASDAVILPLQATLFAVKGLSSITDIITQIKESNFNPDLVLKGILFVMHDERPIVSRDIAAQVKEMVGNKILNTFIRSAKLVEEAVMSGRHIFDYEAALWDEDDTKNHKRRKQNNVTIDYMNLYNELFLDDQKNRDEEDVPLTDLGTRFKAYLGQNN
ncbi:MAG: AAA family ATPase [Bacteroidota bacterium]